MPLFGLFAVIWIQIRIFDPDADFDRDGPRYTELTLMYNYWPLFAVKIALFGLFECNLDPDLDC